MEELATALGEQAGCIVELNRAITQIDGTTLPNASTMKKLASTSDNLGSEARELANTVARFTASPYWLVPGLICNSPDTMAIICPSAW